MPCLCKLDGIVHPHSNERPADNVRQTRIGQLPYNRAAWIGKHRLDVPSLVIDDPILHPYISQQTLLGAHQKGDIRSSRCYSSVLESTLLNRMFSPNESTLDGRIMEQMSNDHNRSSKTEEDLAEVQEEKCHLEEMDCRGVNVSHRRQVKDDEVKVASVLLMSILKSAERELDRLDVGKE